ncbi:MAG: hypothetical protein JWO80_4541 [Bryobacterales bacterium]|nr:hypothetical protein [Bryobacterales bacterium]
MRVLALLLVAFAALVYADVTGKFAGTWTSGASGNGGDLQMAISPGASGEWTARSSFTYQGQEVKTEPLSVKIEGDRVEVVFGYDIGDAKLHSTMRGVLSGEKITGRYVSQDAGGQAVDEGTWAVTRK